jgi:fibronectin type 3 domain-containing protein
MNFIATAVPAPIQHTVTLSWAASVSPNIMGYKVYRGSVSGGPYTLVSGSLVGTTAYADSSVSSGQTYYYVTTAVDSSNVQSAYSNEAIAVVPTP